MQISFVMLICCFLTKFRGVEVSEEERGGGGKGGGKLPQEGHPPFPCGRKPSNDLHNICGVLCKEISTSFKVN